VETRGVVVLTLPFDATTGGAAAIAGPEAVAGLEAAIGLEAVAGLEAAFEPEALVDPETVDEPDAADEPDPVAAPRETVDPDELDPPPPPPQAVISIDMASKPASSTAVTGRRPDSADAPGAIARSPARWCFENWGIPGSLVVRSGIVVTHAAIQAGMTRYLSP
jgi:hypothetical protein